MTSYVELSTTDLGDGNVDIVILVNRLHRAHVVTRWDVATSQARHDLLSALAARTAGRASDIGMARKAPEGS